ncbi:MAG: adenine phosphoribosyltransferase [Candidatus Methylacidiphilales bacterium]|nr:adenine phosphoribosyltransferase [Candidatus Methylacidiphilales bacterium]
MSQSLSLDDTTTDALAQIKAGVREIPDFPKPGILFLDITPIIGCGKLFKLTVDHFAERYKDQKIDAVVAIDARGFIFGSALAYALGTGVALVRKAGKLPHLTYKTDYTLEYGSNTVEMHIDALKKGDRAIIIDDLLATGGTAAAAAKLVEQTGASVAEIAVVIELGFLNGRKLLEPHPVYSALLY